MPRGTIDEAPLEVLNAARSSHISYGVNMTDDTRKPMYSPAQVRAATFLGGPLAGSHLLWSNFITLGDHKSAKVTAIVGTFLLGILFAIGFAESPFRRPSLLIPLLVCFAYDGATGIYQLKKDAIASSTEYRFQSDWKVAGVGLTWLAVTIALWIVIALIIAAVGADVQD